MTGIERIAKERQRQINKEGWTPEHDDEHGDRSLVMAAVSYCGIHGVWPWDIKWWKPSPDPIRNLEKAGALIAAEIDRLERSKLAQDNSDE